MPVRVIVPPDPLITPAQVPGDHPANDESVGSMITAAQSRIDGPFGWVGRSFAPQVIEVSFACWGDVCKLPYGPVIAIESISYVDAAGVEQLLADDAWSLDGDFLYLSSTPPATATNRAHPIKLQYEVGYDGADPSSGGTGYVPEQVKAAIVEGVQQMVLARSENLSARSIEVPDVETVTFLDADKVSAIMRKSAEGLLSGLWVPLV